MILIVPTILIAWSWSVPESNAADSPLANGKAIEFKASKLDGSSFDAGSLKGKIVLLDFWAVGRNYASFQKERAYEEVWSFSRTDLPLLINTGC